VLPIRQKNYLEPTDQEKAIYQAYPRHVAPQAAFAAIRKALTVALAEELLAATSDYAEAQQGHPDITKIPHPATWFNRMGWQEDPTEWTAWQTSGRTGNERF